MDTGLPDKYWAEACAHSTYLINAIIFIIISSSSIIFTMLFFFCFLIISLINLFYHTFWTQISLSLWCNEQTTITIFLNKMSHFFFLSSSLDLQTLEVGQ